MKALERKIAQLQRQLARSIPDPMYVGDTTSRQAIAKAAKEMALKVIAGNKQNPSKREKRRQALAKAKEVGSFSLFWSALFLFSHVGA